MRASKDRDSTSPARLASSRSKSGEAKPDRAKPDRVKPGPVKPGHAKPGRADYRALSDFRHAIRRFLEFSQNAAREIGLTPRQHQALLAIMGYPDPEGVTIGGLADRLRLRHHSAVELADRLVQLDLVRRVPDSRDRRKVFLSLTDKAEELLDRLSSAHLDELRRIEPVFTSLLERLKR
jgi:DNA-binding MarR family transcriptional regulator